MKKLVKKSISCSIRHLGKSKIGVYLFEQLLNSIMNRTQSVCQGQVNLKFIAANQLNQFRIDTFFTKEPETLQWIDKFPSGSIFWDIGANIGLYSCYAAKIKNANVFAFEPSVFNLEILTRNIFINDLTHKVVIVPLPMQDNLSISTFNMTNTEWGGALSTFGKNYGWDGKKIKEIFKFQTVGLSADQTLKLLELPQPNYIKIDVDGIEHLILRGAKTILDKIDSILIEINDDFSEQSIECRKILTDAGLTFQKKYHQECPADLKSSGGGNVCNQIWQR